MYNLGEIKTLINSKCMLLLIHILPMSLASCGFLSRNTVYFEVMQSSSHFSTSRNSWRAPWRICEASIKINKNWKGISQVNTEGSHPSLGITPPTAFVVYWLGEVLMSPNHFLCLVVHYGRFSINDGFNLSFVDGSERY